MCRISHPLRHSPPLSFPTKRRNKSFFRPSVLYPCLCHFSVHSYLSVTHTLLKHQPHASIVLRARCERTVPTSARDTSCAVGSPLYALLMKHKLMRTKRRYFCIEAVDSIRIECKSESDETSVPAFKSQNSRRKHCFFWSRMFNECNPHTE